MFERRRLHLLLGAALTLSAFACSSDVGEEQEGIRTGAAGSSVSGSGTGGAGLSTTTGISTTSGPGNGGTSGSVTTGTTSGGSGGASGGSAGVGTGGSRDAGTDAGNRDAGADVPLPTCNYPEWSRSKAYKTGEIVMYMGKPYIALNDNTSLDPTISTFYWAPYAGCKPPAPPPPALCPVLDKLLPNGENTFKAMLTPTFQGWVPLAAYSYTNLCKALATPGLTGFVRSGNETQDKREIAAFFANVALETAYLTYIDEAGHAASAQDYHGRGSLQLTGQANYSDCGAFLGLNLVGQPQLASQAPVIWQSGMWYWMLHANPSVGGAQICHNAIAQGNFGQTVRIIKGDCASASDRAAQYRKNCTMLGVDPGTTTCQ